MSALPDQRLERFARALAKGASPFAATVAAGIKTDRADAEQSAKHPKIAARVAELRAIRAHESVTTPDEQFEALEKVRQLAMGGRNPSGAISAIEQKARLCGGIAANVSIGVQREPVTFREAAVKIAKRVRRNGLELRHFPRSASKLEKMVKHFLAGETTADEEVAPACDTISPSDNRTAILIQLIKELDQALQLAMILGKSSVAIRAIKAKGRLEQQLTKLANEKEETDDKSQMTRMQLERLALFVLNRGVSDPDGVCS